VEEVQLGGRKRAAVSVFKGRPFLDLREMYEVRCMLLLLHVVLPLHQDHCIIGTAQRSVHQRVTKFPKGT
jgi:hypothetical protein